VKRQTAAKVLDEGAAGLFWLDKKLSVRRGEKRIPNWALESACEAGGHRGGFQAMYDLKHKVATAGSRRAQGFHDRILDIVDSAERHNAERRAAASELDARRRPPASGEHFHGALEDPGAGSAATARGTFVASDGTLDVGASDKRAALHAVRHLSEREGAARVPSSLRARLLPARPSSRTW